MVSAAVTVATQVLAFPFTSNTVSTIEFVPMLLQSKVVGETERLSIPQLSFEPPSTNCGVMMVSPLASN